MAGRRSRGWCGSSSSTDDSSSSSSSRISNITNGNMDLIIPHMKMHERAFLLRPCMDLIPHYIHPVLNKILTQLWQEFPHTNKQECKRVFPMGKYHDGKRRMLSMDKKHIFVVYSMSLQTGKTMCTHSHNFIYDTIFSKFP